MRITGSPLAMQPDKSTQPVRAFEIAIETRLLAVLPEGETTTIRISVTAMGWVKDRPGSTLAGNQPESRAYART